MSDVVHVRNDQYSILKNHRTYLPQVEKFNNNIINIPVGWWLKESDIKYITEIINNYNV